jgi:predicted ATPase
VIRDDTPRRDEALEASAPTPPFHVLLRRYRLAAGMTQEALAERSTLSVRAISELERGSRRRPQRETLHLLEEALELTSGERDQFAAAARGLRHTPLAAVPSPAAPPNLPTPLTPLIGRAADLHAVAALVRAPETRLVTVTGVGGVGKTRIALAVTAEIAPTMPAGVCFVPLATICDPTLVPSAIAQALGASGGHPPVWETVSAHLRERQLLLVLDNFEQVIAAADGIAALLAHCPFLKVLVTSRAALRIGGEHVYSLAPLALPDPAMLPEVGGLARIPAVALFVQRARAADHTFTLTPEVAAAVAAICIRLDGLPLALELAAARTRLLPPAALLARLDRRLPLLTGTGHGVPERQQTLRATIDWSHDLLTEAEQRLFRRLAVFVGGCTLEAVEAVCALDHAPIIDALESLVAQSLVQREPWGERVRFTMLETIHEYAHERLTASGEETAIRQAHGDYFLTLIDGTDQYLHTDTPEAAIRRLRADYANLRAAVRWGMLHRDIHWALQFVWGLDQFFQGRGNVTEGRVWMAEWLKELLPVVDPAHPLNGWALQGTGVAAMEAGDYDAARDALARAVRHGIATGDRALVASTQYRIARIAQLTGDLTTARATAEEFLAIRREIATPWAVAFALAAVGQIALDQGDLAAAHESIAEGLAIAAAIANRLLAAGLHYDEGRLALREADMSRAADCFRASLRGARAVGHPVSAARCLEALAEIAVRQSNPTHAAELLGAAVTLRTIAAALPTPNDQARIDRVSATARAALGAEDFEAVWAVGAARTPEEVMTRTVTE